MMENKCKRFLSLLLAFVMVLGMFPAGHVHAADGVDGTTINMNVDDKHEITVPIYDAQVTISQEGVITAETESVPTNTRYTVATTATRPDAEGNLPEGKYVILNRRMGTALESNPNGNKLWMAAYPSTAEVWTVKAVADGYTVTASNGKYLTIGDGTAGTTDAPTTLTFAWNKGGNKDSNYADAWSLCVKNVDEHLCQFGSGTAKVAAGYEQEDDQGAQWDLYAVTPAQEYTWKLADETVTAIEPGSYYIFEAPGATSRNASLVSAQWSDTNAGGGGSSMGLRMENTKGNFNEKNVWKITASTTEGKYNVQDLCGWNMFIASGKAMVTPQSHPATVAQGVANAETWQITNDDSVYLHWWGIWDGTPSYTQIAGWSSKDGGNSQWNIYKVNPTPVGSTTVTITAVQPGTTTLTIGDVTYTITVNEVHVHNFVGDVTTLANCVDEGVKTFTCVCGEGTYTEVIPVDSKNHKTTEIRPEVKPTLTKEGKTEEVYCTACNTSVSGGQVIPQLTMKNAKVLSDNRIVALSDCEYLLTSTGETTWSLSHAGTYFVKPSANGNAYPQSTAAFDQLTLTANGDAIWIGSALSGGGAGTGSIHVHNNDETPYWNRCTGGHGNQNNGTHDLYFFIANNDGTGAEIPGYTMVKKDALVSGKSYLIAFKNGNGTWYIMNPSNAANDHVALLVTDAVTHTHDYTVETVTKDPTCAETGLKDLKCSCGHFHAAEHKNVEIPAAHGTITHVDPKAANCTEAGNVEHWRCETCGETWSDEACEQEIEDATIPALGHCWDRENAGYCVTDYTCCRCGEETNPNFKIKVYFDNTKTQWEAVEALFDGVGNVGGWARYQGIENGMYVFLVHKDAKTVAFNNGSGGAETITTRKFAVEAGTIYSADLVKIYFQENNAWDEIMVACNDDLGSAASRTTVDGKHVLYVDKDTADITAHFYLDGEYLCSADFENVEAGKTYFYPACTHSYTYDCDTDCKVCGQNTRPSATHVSDAVYDCVAGKCQYCETPMEAAASHTPDTDDGDCTTAIKCTVCGQEATAAKSHAWAEEGTYTEPTFEADGFTTYNCTNSGCNETNVETHEGSKLVAVAQIGNQKFTSLQAAFDAVQKGDDIELLKDIELDTYLTVDNPGNYCLDLHGHNITRVGGTAIYVNNNATTLSIEALYGGKVTGEQAIFAAAGTVKIYRGTFHGTGDAIYAYGTGHIVIYGGTFSAEGPAGTQNAYCVLNVHDGSRATASISVHCDYKPTFIGFNPADNLSEGAGTNFLAIPYYYCSRENNGKWTVVRGHDEVVDQAKAATCTETGLTGGMHCSACGKVLVKQDVIPAKDHSWDISSYTNNGANHTVNYGCKNDASHTKSETEAHNFTNGDCVCGEKAPVTYVAEADGEKFATLQEAVDSADDVMVTLLADVELTERLDISGYVILELNGHTISGDVEGAYGMIYVKQGATLNIEGAGYIIANKTHAIGNYGTVHVHGGNIVTNADESYAALYNFYYQPDYYGTSSIAGGSLDSVFNCGGLYVYDGHVAYLDNSGDMRVRGGQIDKIYARDGSDAPGLDRPGTIEIADPANITVPEGFKLVKVDEDRYQVVAVTYVAEINGEKYETLAAALTAAQSGDTVLLLADCENQTVIPEGAVLDLNGHALMVTGLFSGCISINNGAIKLADDQVFFGSNGAVITTNGVLYMSTTGFAMTGGTFMVKDIEGEAFIVTVTGTAKLVIENCQFSAFTAYLDSTDASIEAPEGMNVTTTQDGYEVVYEDGTYTLVEKIVARIGVQSYTTLAAALNAAQPGDTVKLLADCESAGNIPEGAALDLNGHKLYLTITSPIIPYGCIITNGGAIAMKLGENDLEIVGPNGTYKTDGSIMILSETGFTMIAGTVTLDNDVSHVSITVTGTAKLVFNDCTIEEYNLILDSTTASIEGPEDLNVTTTQDGYEVVYENGTYTLVEKAPVTYVAMIGEQGYATLAEAVAVGGEVTLLADVELTERLDISGTVSLKLNGHTISGDFVDAFGMIYVKKGGELTLVGDGSIIAEKTHAIGNYGYVSVEGGNIVSNADETYAGLYNFYYQADYYGSADIFDGGSVDSVFNCGNLNVYGGHVAYVDNSGHLAVLLCEINEIYARDGSDAPGVIGAGEIFIANPANIANITVPEGFKLVNIGEDTYQVVAKTYVAEINGEKYETLAAAIAAATAGDTITFVADITENVTINKSVTIDGAGKTYTGKMTPKADTTIKNVNFDGKGNNGYAVQPEGAGNVVIEDCTVKNYYGFVQVKSNNVTTTVKNVTVSDCNYGIKIDYSYGVVLENVKLDCSEAGLLNSNYATKTITIKNSDISILGTWYRNKPYKTTYVFEGANSVDQFIIEEAYDNFKLAAGATLTAPEGINVVSGVEDYKVKYEEGTYKLVKAAIAKIGNVEYSSLQEAVDAAKAGVTITLVCDAEGPGVVIDKNLTIEFAGYTYTLTEPVGSNGTESNGFQILAGNTVRLLNGKLEVAESADDKFYILVQNYANLTVQGMILDGTNLDKYAFTDGDSYTLSNNSGSVNVNKSTIIANDEGNLAFAFDVCDQTSKGYSLPKVIVYASSVIEGNIEAVAKSGNTYYATLQQAVDAVAAGSNIYLVRNSSGAGVVINKKVNIDFKGFTYTLTSGVGSTGTETNGFQILKGNTVSLKNGELKVAESAADKFYILVQNYADLTIEKMTLDGTNLDKWSKHEDQITNGDSYTLSNNSGKVTIGANTKIIANNEGSKAFAFDVCDKSAWGYELPVVTVHKTADIQGNIEAAAKIGNVYYATLNQAIEAASNKQTITLMSDINLNKVETVLLDGSYNTYFKVEGKTLTIDLNGKTISGAYTDTSNMLVGLFSTDNGGHLTLTGNGTVNLTEGDGATVYALISNYEPGCTITIEDGSYILDSAQDCLMHSSPDKGLIIKGGNFELGNVAQGHWSGNRGNGSPWIINVNGKNAGAAVVSGGTYNYDISNQHWIFEVAIEDGKGNLGVIVDNGDGTWTVTGDTAEAAIVKLVGNYTRLQGYATIEAAAEAAKDGDTIILKRNVEFDTITVDKNLTIDANGYKIAGKFVLANAAAALTAPEGLNVTTTVKNSVVKYIDGAYKVVAAVAKTGDGKLFATLEEAVAYANANLKETTISLLKNVEVSETLVIDTAAIRAIGTSGKTIKSTADVAIRVAKNTKSLYIRGTLDTSAAPAGSVAIQVETASNVKLDSTTKIVAGGNVAFKLIKTAKIISMVDSKITAGQLIVSETKGAVTFDMHGTTATISGNYKAAIEIYSGKLIVTNSKDAASNKNTIKVVGEHAVYVAGTNLANYAGVIDFENQTGFFEKLKYMNVTTEAGYQKYFTDMVQNANTGKCYGSLSEAVNAAADGDTVTVLADHELVWDGETVIDGSLASMIVVAGKSVTIDLNGKKLTVDASKMNGTDLYAVFAADEGGMLTLTGNGTVTATGIGFKSNATAYCLMMAYEAGTKLVVENGTYTMEAAGDSLIYSGTTANKGEGDQGVIVMDGIFNLGNVGTGSNGKPWIFNTLGSNQRHAWILGGTFNADVNHQYWIHEAQLPGTLALKNNGDGTWTVVEAAAYVVEKHNGYSHNVGYVTVEEAQAAAAAKGWEVVIN